MMHKSLFVSAQNESALCMSLDLDNGTAFSAVQIPMRYLSALYSLFKRAKMCMPHWPILHVLSILSSVTATNNPFVHYPR
ncbi:unnamed protein product [Rhodiola kirilowii]